MRAKSKLEVRIRSEARVCSEPRVCSELIVPLNNEHFMQARCIP